MENTGFIECTWQHEDVGVGGGLGDTTCTLPTYRLLRDRAEEGGDSLLNRECNCQPKGYGVRLILLLLKSNVTIIIFAIQDWILRLVLKDSFLVRRRFFHFLTRWCSSFSAFLSVSPCSLYIWALDVIRREWGFSEGLLAFTISPILPAFRRQSVSRAACHRLESLPLHFCLYST